MKIQEFSFGNFKSFKDIQTLNLSAAKIKSKHPEIDVNNIIAGKNNENISFLKSKAIYGANASGKSNVSHALNCFIWIIGNSVVDKNALQYLDSFKLSTETENEPSFFQMIFWDQEVKYRYGFEADNKNITAEWLYGKPKERELPYFIRDRQKIVELDKTNFSEAHKLIKLLGEDLEVNNIFRNNSLFLSTLASFGFGKLSKQLVDSLTSNIFLINGLGYKKLYKKALDLLNNDIHKKFMIDLLKDADIGIEDVNAIDLSSINIDNEFDSKEEKKVLVSSKKKYDKNLDLKNIEYFVFDNKESEGTKKLLELSPFIYNALKRKAPIFIDEFDARFHPLLTKKIVALFNSKENGGSQLIFTTHDTNLLSSNLLRRDQIEFVEKDKYGASHLYSLAQFKGIRNTASFEKDYIQGKYGAIPFLGDFRKLISEENA